MDGADRRRERALLSTLSALGLAVAVLCAALLLRPGSHADGSPSALAARAAAAASQAARTVSPSPSPSPSSPSSPPSPSRSSRAPSATPSRLAPPAPITGRAAPTRTPVVYVVKPGDSLWRIAQWFHMNGYGNLYDANKSVLGKNPGLITPGERITVSATGVSGLR